MISKLYLMFLEWKCFVCFYKSFWNVKSDNFKWIVFRIVVFYVFRMIVFVWFVMISDK